MVVGTEKLLTPPETQTERPSPMNSKILISYASKFHSTREIAEFIAKELTSNWMLEVDVFDCQEVQDLVSYRAVIVGSAIYNDTWLDSAVRLVSEKIVALEKRKVWLFSSGPVEKGSHSDLLKNWSFPDPLASVFRRIAPQGMKIFGGKFDEDRLPIDDWLFNRDLRGLSVDNRDWKEIRNWSASIAKALKVPQTVSHADKAASLAK